MDAFIARQPIFDVNKKLYAYELLFRDGLCNCMPQVEGDVATSKVLSNAYLTTGLSQITGGRRAFINFTEKLILKEMPLFFPKETTVVEILEDVPSTGAVLAAGRKLSEQGYIIALDDFVFQPDMASLIDLADIIKVDFRLAPISKITEYLEKGHLRGATLLAEKVETHEEFRLAVDLGFTYFQGYFFSKPEVIKGKDISGSRFRLLQIMASVNQPDFEFEEVENLVHQDLAISYKLLAVVNSAFFIRRSRVTSIKEALVFLGQNDVRRFVSLIALSHITSDKPNELIRCSCIRARFCESLSTVSTCSESADELFTLGLFSNIDSLLDRSMDAVMAKLPLSQKIVDALVYDRGELSKYLVMVKCYEKGDWSSVKFMAVELCIAEETIPPIYKEACEWATAIMAE